MSVKLFNISIDNISFNDAFIKATSLFNENKVSQIVTINPEMIEFAKKNNEFLNIVNDADLVIPDGIGVKIALLINNIKTDRIPGIEFAEKLIEYSNNNNLPVAIIGAKQENLTLAIEKLKEKYKNLNIIYSHDGYFQDNQRIYDKLAEFSPKLVLVALGSPKQEYFIHNAKNALNSGLMIGIGGSIDVWSGNVKRAPKIFQKLGLEWFYRTIKQPERLKRIFPALPLFIIRTIIDKYKKI